MTVSVLGDSRLVLLERDACSHCYARLQTCLCSLLCNSKANLMHSQLGIEHHRLSLAQHQHAMNWRHRSLLEQVSRFRPTQVPQVKLAAFQMHMCTLPPKSLCMATGLAETGTDHGYFRSNCFDACDSSEPYASY